MIVACVGEGVDGVGAVVVAAEGAAANGLAGEDVEPEGGAARVAGNGTPKKEASEIERLKRAVAKRDQVIGELPIANRLWGNVEGDPTP